MFTVKATAEFEAWVGSLRDRATVIRLNKRLDKAARGLLGDVKQVGKDVWEMREFFGPGWRMYYTIRGAVLIVMLGGGSKASQNNDIATAIALAQTIEE